MNSTLTQENKESAQFWLFTSFYGISSLFFTANFYSYGIDYAFLSIFLAAVLLGPLFGLLSILLETALLQGISRLLGGSTTFRMLSMSVVRSKAPTLFTLILWAVLCTIDSKTVFVQGIYNGSAVIIVLSTFLVILASFFLLIKSLRKLENFGWFRSFSAVFVMYWLTFFVFSTMLFIARYIFISLF